MTVKSRDIKLLWGLAAGKCSYPECHTDCVDFLTGGPIVIGEMAHVIARQPGGPRGESNAGEDTYENLILLCPTHHTEIDKAPADNFPSELLLDWKRQHEGRIRELLSSPNFLSMKDIATYIQRLLIENFMVWKTYGPESEEAKRNPTSNASEMWTYRKLVTIVPNNRKIVKSLQSHSHLFDANTYAESPRLYRRLF